MPIASWEEAQLIIAEVQGGQEAVQAINRLRTKYNLPQFQSTDAAAIRQQVIEERKRQLFSEGHRLGDKLRFREPWPDGRNHKLEPYGPVTCMPLPEQEKLNNPNIK